MDQIAISAPELRVYLAIVIGLAIWQVRLTLGLDGTGRSLAGLADLSVAQLRNSFREWQFSVRLLNTLLPQEALWPKLPGVTFIVLVQLSFGLPQQTPPLRAQRAPDDCSPRVTLVLSPSHALMRSLRSYKMVNAIPHLGTFVSSTLSRGCGLRYRAVFDQEHFHRSRYTGGRDPVRACQNSFYPWGSSRRYSKCLKTVWR
jgi:hypothetical protein